MNFPEASSIWQLQLLNPEYGLHLPTYLTLIRLGKDQLGRPENLAIVPIIGYSRFFLRIDLVNRYRPWQLKRLKALLIHRELDFRGSMHIIFRAELMSNHHGELIHLVVQEKEKSMIYSDYYLDMSLLRIFPLIQQNSKQSNDQDDPLDYEICKDPLELE
jgi:hypothetical protein